jgi:hypothetical protein
MNKNLLLGSLALTCLFSTQLWSFGSTIDLGIFNVRPGESMNINVDESNLYTGMSYRVECPMQPVSEVTTIGVYANPSRQVSCGDYYHEGIDICNISLNSKVNVFFRSITKGSKYILTIRNFDQKNNLTFVCKAVPRND